MGSKLGWIIGGLIGAALLALIVKVVFFPSATAPTRETTYPGRLTLQTPSESVTLVLPEEPSGPGDAGEDYQVATQTRKDNLDALLRVLQNYSKVLKGEYRLSEDDLALLKQVADPVAAGADKRNMTYYFRLTPQAIEVPYWPEEADLLQDVTNPSLLLAVQAIKTGPEGYPAAERRLQDIFTVGWHLMNERARLDLVIRGIGLQRAACLELVNLYRLWEKPERVEQVKRYVDGLQVMSSTYRALYKVVWAFVPQPGGTNGPHPGDVWNLAVNHPDRAVRSEAILGLGLVKMTSSKRGDLRRAARTIAAKLGGPDPIERAAAKAADQLDVEGYRKLLKAHQ